MILSNNQMLYLHSNNDFEQIGKNLVRYGQIISDEFLEYDGNHLRDTTFTFDGWTWSVSKISGDVIKISIKA